MAFSTSLSWCYSAYADRLHNKQLLSEIMQIETHELLLAFLMRPSTESGFMRKKVPRWGHVGLLKQNAWLVCLLQPLLHIPTVPIQPLLMRWALEKLLLSSAPVTKVLMPFLENIVIFTNFVTGLTNFFQKLVTCFFVGLNSDHFFNALLILI